MEAVGRLQGELIAAQSELSSLRAIYADDNARVRQARGQVDELESQLRKMSGAGEDANAGNLKDGGQLPSLRKLPLLGVEYNDLYRKQVMQETLYEALSKQYELARVEEAKEVSQVMVLDHADLPERKSSPHRSIITLVGGLVFALLGIAWVLGQKLWELADDSHPAKALAVKLRNSIRTPNQPVPS